MSGSVRRLPRLRLMRARNRPIVLLYHRIAPAGPDPQLLCVTAEHFAEHLRIISDRYVPVRLDVLVPHAARGRTPARAVAIAFDDGYADNLLAAKPLLEQAVVPATVFVASGYVHNGRSFWWDELEGLLLRAGRLPSALSLQIGHETLVWKLGEDAAYAHSRAAKCAAWTVLDESDPGPRQRIYRDLCARLRSLGHVERERALEQLRAVAESDSADCEMPRPLTLAELACLAEGDLIEVGAHTVTHPTLAQLPARCQQKEVVESKRQLEQILDRPVTSFAYPYGTPADFDETTVSLVREAGFARACANVAGRLTRQTDPFRIPRVVVRDWTGDELDRRLSAFA
jgi:peptidoglycan/xylan/chitin deacetylase (PgdA/CDA1 family)